MKRLTVFLCVMTILCTGCSSSEQAQEQTVDPVAQVDEAFGIVDDDIEDYTSYNTQMVFAIASDMYEHPSNYYQKKIRLNGKFATAFDEPTQQRFYYCVVYDTAGYCNVPLIFIPTDEMVYPDDYPEEGGDITIQGTYELMYSNNEMYVVIKDTTVIKE